jgi:SAM-dependent methyltransferase
VTAGTYWPASPPRMSERKWVDFLLGRRAIDGLTAPPLPDETIQAQFVGSFGPEAFIEAKTFCAKLRDAADRYLGGLRADTDVLDFGVGWGRLYRVMLNQVAPRALVGVDIDQMCVDLCRDAMPYGTFARNDPGPPLAFADGSFDIVYAYSVFSHLAPHVAAGWLADIGRLLRPGGLLLFTTLKAAHLDVWRRQAAEAESYHAVCLRDVGFQYDEWRDRADRGEALYLPIGGGDCREASFYGETVITKPGVMVLARETGFEVCVFDQGSDLPQAFAVLRRAGSREERATGVPA